MTGPPAIEPVPRIAWWQAVKASDLPPSARLLAFVMSTYMDPDGSRCFPGQDALAEACGWSDARSVRRALATLTDAGYVVVEPYAGHREDGRAQATHRYVPKIPRRDQPDADVREESGTSRTQVSGRNATSRTLVATSRTSEAFQSDADVRQPPHDLSKDPSTSHARAPAHARAADASGGGGDSWTTSPQARRAYDLVCAELRADRLGDRARDAIAARIDRDGWTPAQVVTAATAERPEPVDRPTGFVATRLERATGPPEPGRPGPRLAALEDPSDGWADPEPTERVEGTCAAPGDCPEPIVVVEMNGTAWCAGHAETRPVEQAAAS